MEKTQSLGNHIWQCVPLWSCVCGRSALATESTARVDELHALVDELQISTRDTESLIGTKDGVGGQPTGSYRKVKDQSNDIYSLKERHAKKVGSRRVWRRCLLPVD